MEGADLPPESLPAEAIPELSPEVIEKFNNNFL
jgi:hypothetical protein